MLRGLEAPYTRRELAELDRHQAAARQLLLDADECCVTESMEALRECLGAALALDLIDADDFARRPAGAAEMLCPAAPDRPTLGRLRRINAALAAPARRW